MRGNDYFKPNFTLKRIQTSNVKKEWFSILKTGSRKKKIEKKQSRELMLSLLSPHLKDWLEFQVGMDQLTTENVHVFLESFIAIVLSRNRVDIFKTSFLD